MVNQVLTGSKVKYSRWLVDAEVETENGMNKRRFLNCSNHYPGNSQMTVGMNLT